MLKGKAFYSLLLPATLTGFLVHVNACFGLNKKCSGLKWPGIDNKNVFLARQVICPFKGFI
jgi:hypothetical protein